MGSFLLGIQDVTSVSVLHRSGSIRTVLICTSELSFAFAFHAAGKQNYSTIAPKCHYI